MRRDICAGDINFAYRVADLKHILIGMGHETMDCVCAKGCDQWKDSSNSISINRCCQDWEEYSFENCSFDTSEKPDCNSVRVAEICQIESVEGDILTTIDEVAKSALPAEGQKRQYFQRKVR